MLDVRRKFTCKILILFIFIPKSVLSLLTFDRSNPYQNDESSGPLLKISQGFIRGFTMETQNFRKFYAFQGIPYAKPPVGELRFKPPVPIEPWDGILEATREGNICLQSDLVLPLSSTFGSEDCLYLNVYTPKLPDTDSKKLLPVLVFIHGGGFSSQAGSTFFHGPKKFMDYNLIMVDLNYRLGPLGFLSTGDKTIPGNFGLLDQLMVLKWVKQNIRYFGGDPDSVTLMGLSAGSFSANIHLISPLSKDLFHRLILHSGIVTMPLLINPNPLKTAVAFGETVGCSRNSTQQMQCLLKKDAATLTNAAAKLYYQNVMMVLPQFVPVVDGIFLPEHPRILLERGDYPKIPILTGTVRDEATLFFELEKFLSGIKDSFVENLKTLLGSKETSEENEKHLEEGLLYRVVNTFSTSLSEAQINYPTVLREYFPSDESLCLKTVPRITNQILSDILFHAPLNNFLKMVFPNLRAYMFNFEYTSTIHTVGFLKAGDEKVSVVTHGDEVKYLFDGPYSLIKATSEDLKISKVMLSLWTNFITNGNPSPNNQPVQWDPITSDAIEYLEITKNFTMKSRYRSDKIQFINDVFLNKIKNGLSLNFDIDRIHFPSDEFKTKYSNKGCAEGTIKTI